MRLESQLDSFSHDNADFPGRQGRPKYMSLQFDDGKSSHYDIAHDIFKNEYSGYDFFGSFGIPIFDGQLAETPEKIVEMFKYGHSIQDHSDVFPPADAAFWGQPEYANQWAGKWDEIVVGWRAIGLPDPTAWNQPGGTGAAFGLAQRQFWGPRVKYVGGRVGLQTLYQVKNFHWNFNDDPLSLGRFVSSWGFNGGGDAAEETANIITICADAIACGGVPVPVWHDISEGDGTADAVRACCNLATAAGFEILPLEVAFDRMNDTSTWTASYVEQIANPNFQDTYNGDATRPDGWDNTTLVTSSVNDEQAGQVVLVDDTSRTFVYGPNRGTNKILLKGRMAAGSRGSYNIAIVRYQVDPETFVYSQDTVFYNTGALDTTAWKLMSFEFEVDERTSYYQITFPNAASGTYIADISCRRIGP